ncbi:hypothetical protein [Sphingosinicella sp.]|uniref:hypothetical protein n=1 Tax=Sphingosinicella sp. TaxID=1917971 RepID=UPI004037E755
MNNDIDAFESPFERIASFLQLPLKCHGRRIAVVDPIEWVGAAASVHQPFAGLTDSFLSQ